MKGAMLQAGGVRQSLGVVVAGLMEEGEKGRQWEDGDRSQA